MSSNYEGEIGMKETAVVYTSNMGHSKRYASMIANKLGLPMYELKEASKSLEKGSSIIYVGWVFASMIKKYKKASKRYKVCTVCAVGLCDTGKMKDEIRTASSISEDIELFTVQGGIDKKELRGMNSLLIRMLLGGLSKQKNLTPQDQRIYELLKTDADYVSEDNLKELYEYYEAI